MAPDKPYEVLEGAAEIGFRCWGADPSELFVNAAHALFAIAADTSQVEPTCRLIFGVSRRGEGELLVRWLDQLIHTFDQGLFVPVTFWVQTMTPTSFVCHCEGEERDLARHPWKRIVRGVANRDLEVTELEDGRWTAMVIFEVAHGSR